MVIGAMLLSGCLVGSLLTVRQQQRAQAMLDEQLVHVAAERAAAVEAYFERARAVTLVTSHNPAFAQFYLDRRPALVKRLARTAAVQQVQSALDYLEVLYPASIGEACFIDLSGTENARVVHGRAAPAAELSTDERSNPFFWPTLAQPVGTVYQARPYRSPDTGDMVVSNSTLVAGANGRPLAIVHFEVTMDSFRQLLMASSSARTGVDLVESTTGAVVSEGANQPHPRDASGARDVVVDIGGNARATGLAWSGGQRIAFHRVHSRPGNANRWYVVAHGESVPVAPLPLLVLLGLFGPLAIWLILLAVHYMRAERRNLQQAAVTDDLTQLPNRTHLNQRVSAALQAMGNDHKSRVLMLIDLDDFKEVNDTLGHSRGDELLREVAERLRETLRATDTLVRLGGDEFAVLLDGPAGAEEAAQAAARIGAGLQRPFTGGPMQLQVRASIGTAIAPQHGTDLLTLLQRADVAMYQAKRAGTGHCVYAAERDTHSTRKLALAGSLRGAIERREIVPFFQPLVDAQTGEVVAAEALARWEHPELGLLGPTEFIPLAEETGLIHELTMSMLDQSLRQCRLWQDRGENLCVSVNFSATDLVDLGVFGRVTKALAQHGVAAAKLTVEITETGLFSDRNRAMRIIGQLAAAGVQVALDDFGTGYATLSVLREYPIDVVKIDRSFVHRMLSDPADAVIVRATLDLASSLGLRSVAEGVEDQEVLLGLRAAGCSLIQGYYYTPPLPAQEFDHWLVGYRAQLTSAAT